MANFSSRFDLFVRKAHSCTDEERQLDYVLGAMLGLSEWLFLADQSASELRPAKAEIDGNPYFLVFSDVAQFESAIEPTVASAPSISIPAGRALEWVAKSGGGVLVDPGDHAVLIPGAQVREFHAAWHERGGLAAAGFWIPGMTSADEDFWQEHDL